MRNKGLLLLKTLLLSTSRRNIYRHTTDKKKKKKITGSYIGAFCLYAMLMGYSITMCIGYGHYGIIDSTPVMCALIISALAFIFTFMKTNGYLFNFKEYDMLMSLPFETSAVAACKFMYMYIKSLPWYLSISVSMMTGYGIYAHPSFAVYPIWLILSLILPIIPMLAAAFLGFLIARISTGFKKTNLIQTILSFVFVIFCFSLRYIIEALVKDDKVQATLEKTSEITGNTAKVYLPAAWFADAVRNGSIAGFLLLTVVSILLFAGVFMIVGRSYRNINSALKTHTSAGKYKMTVQKKRSVVQAVAYKELKRMTGSTTYMVNVAMGEILAALFGIVTLIFGFNRIIAIVTQNAPFDPAIVQPAIPFIIYFFIGMMSSTVCSPSLEGKNYWIVRSLPIDSKVLYQGKMLFNMYLTVPFMVFSTLCVCLSARMPFVDTVMYLVLGFMLCAFSTTWGCVCGIKHMRFDWENEVEVIKQGAGVAIYMFPNMFAVMGLTVGVIFLGMRMDHKVLALVFTLITGLLALLSYARVISMAKSNK